MIAAALALALSANASAERAERIFAVANRAAAVYDHSIEFFVLPPETMATVSGRSAFGPLAENGMLLFWPELKPAKVISFNQKLIKPARPERNGYEFLACAEPTDKEWIDSPGGSDETVLRNFCGVLNLAGTVVYQAPQPKDGAVEALALSSDGSQALFEYRKGKDVESYLVWTRGARRPKTYKADMRDLALRRTLNRFGLNDWNPEPEKNPKPETRK